MECSICYNNILDTNKVITECNHVFHFSCLLKNFKSNPSTGEQCPLCRKSFLQVSSSNNSNTYIPPSNASAIVQFLRERFLQPPTPPPPRNEIIRNILEYRGLAKLKSTYVDALPEQVLEDTGRIHTEYLQTVASTGRLSSINPNMQNIPIRTNRGREIRKAFIARNKDYILLAADYSQIELRVIAALSNEDTMIEAFNNGEDIHASTASRVFNVPLSDVTREQRSNAKTVNFGIIYGVSAFGLSNQTNLNRTESKTLIDAYYATYPKLRDYMTNQVNFARDNGYVKTISDRRRYLKDINSRNAIVRGAAERNAVNAPIQGSAADIIKIAMIGIYNKLEKEGYKTKMLLQVHDELVFDVFKPELETIKKLIKLEMENAYELIVPLNVGIDVGENWLEAH